MSLLQIKTVDDSFNRILQSKYEPNCEVKLQINSKIKSKQQNQIKLTPKITKFR